MVVQGCRCAPDASLHDALQSAWSKQVLFVECRCSVVCREALDADLLKALLSVHRHLALSLSLQCGLGSPVAVPRMQGIAMNCRFIGWTSFELRSCVAAARSSAAVH